MRFQCVAASIERAAEHWFSDGPIVDAVLASAAVPGILPPVEIGGEHYIDGGIVNSSRSTARSRWAPRGSSCCTSAAWTARSSPRAGRGRSRWSPSRSRAATASSATSRRCRRRRGPRAADRPARAAEATTTSPRCATATAARRAGGSSAPTPPRCATSTDARARDRLMPVPHVLIRRLLVAPLILVGEGLIVVASPLLAVVAGVACAVRRRSAPAAGAGAHAELCVAASPHVGCLGSGSRAGSGARAVAAMQHRTTRSCAGSSAAFAHGAADGARRRSSTPAPRRPRRCCRRDERPVVALSRHAGEGDSLLVLHQLLRRHRRRPRIVMHERCASTR